MYRLACLLLILTQTILGTTQTSVKRSIADNSELRHMEWRLQSQIAGNQVDLRVVREEVALLQAGITANNYRLLLQPAYHKLNRLIDQIGLWDSQYQLVKSLNESIVQLWADNILQSVMGYPKIFWTLVELHQQFTQPLSYSNYLEIFSKSVAFSPVQSQRWMTKFEAFRGLKAVSQLCKLWRLANTVVFASQNLTDASCYHYETGLISNFTEAIERLSPTFRSVKMELKLFDSYRREAQIFTNINREMIIPYPRADSNYFGYSPIVGCKLDLQQSLLSPLLQIKCRIISDWRKFEPNKFESNMETLDEIGPPQLSAEYHNSYDGRNYYGDQLSSCWSRVNRTDQFICGLQVASDNRPTSISILACSRKFGSTVVDGWIHQLNCADSHRFSYEGLLDAAYVLPQLHTLIHTLMPTSLEFASLIFLNKIDWPSTFK